MANRRANFCGSDDHRIHRRGFLGAAAVAGAFAANMGVLNVLRHPTLAAELKRQQKHVILLWLAGGPSQLETWDPKPGHDNGGPFRWPGKSCGGPPVMISCGPRRRSMPSMTSGIGR